MKRKNSERMKKCLGSSIDFCSSTWSQSGFYTQEECLDLQNQCDQLTLSPTFQDRNQVEKFKTHLEKTSRYPLKLKKDSFKEKGFLCYTCCGNGPPTFEDKVRKSNKYAFSCKFSMKFKVINNIIELADMYAIHNHPPMQHQEILNKLNSRFSEDMRGKIEKYLRGDFDVNTEKYFTQYVNQIEVIMQMYPNHDWKNTKSKKLQNMKGKIKKEMKGGLKCCQRIKKSKSLQLPPRKKKKTDKSCCKPKMHDEEEWIPSPTPATSAEESGFRIKRSLSHNFQFPAKQKVADLNLDQFDCELDSVLNCDSFDDCCPLQSRRTTATLCSPAISPELLNQPTTSFTAATRNKAGPSLFKKQFEMEQKKKESEKKKEASFFARLREKQEEEQRTKQTKDMLLNDKDMNFRLSNDCNDSNEDELNLELNEFGIESEWESEELSAQSDGVGLPDRIYKYSPHSQKLNIQRQDPQQKLNSLSPFLNFDSFSNILSSNTDPFSLFNTEGGLQNSDN